MSENPTHHVLTDERHNLYSLFPEPWMAFNDQLKSQIRIFVQLQKFPHIRKLFINVFSRVKKQISG